MEYIPTKVATAKVGATSMTTADLAVLILGVALALSLRWYNRWEQQPQPVMQPRWRIIGLFFEEAVGKASLALIPLALWRRARVGEVCRPAELLLAVCAAWMLLDQVDSCPWVFWAWVDHDTWDDLGRPYWLCHGAAGTLSLAAVLALILLRRKLDNSARSVLLMVAVAGSFPWFVQPIDRITYQLIKRYGVEDKLAEVIILVAVGALKYLVPGVVGVAALRDVRRRRSETSLLEGVAVVLALINLSLSLTVWFYTYFMNGFPPLRAVRLYVIYFGPVLASGLIGGGIASAVGPRLCRWLGLR
jgi:hypothetical protein